MARQSKSTSSSPSSSPRDVVQIHRVLLSWKAAWRSAWLRAASAAAAALLASASLPSLFFPLPQFVVVPAPPVLRVPYARPQMGWSRSRCRRAPSRPLQLVQLPLRRWRGRRQRPTWRLGDHRLPRWKAPPRAWCGAFRSAQCTARRSAPSGTFPLRLTPPNRSAGPPPLSCQWAGSL